ncbi:MAG: hypothetical protein H0A75_08720 [Candidatus Methanofishera endochildressiae]|uniref:Uncharacterized protein n=1 Tax=Candidatus Methanofishera endochildressiae TaxID=2738884 RepID=A0A7Z0MPQ4_9GAMM|nr:hypothetical protein [Candidatus Methanofishera endochildressiae]
MHQNSNGGKKNGRFNIQKFIVLYGKDVMNWEEAFTAGKKVQLGEKIGHMQSAG